MLRRALAAHGQLHVQVANLRAAAAAGSLRDARNCGWRIVGSVWECLALVNQSPLRGSLSESPAAVERLVEKPDDLVRRAGTITSSNDVALVLEESERLVSDTRDLLRRLQTRIPPSGDVPAQFRRAYPEMKDKIARLLRACERGDRFAAGAEAWLLQVDLATLLGPTTGGAGHAQFNLQSELDSAYLELGFPDLLGASATELAQLVVEVRRLDARLRSLLDEHGVDRCEFDSVAALARALTH
jgi:hypothetical protein